MYELVMQKMREGDWGEVAGLMRERYGAMIDFHQRCKHASHHLDARARFAFIAGI